MQNYIVINGLLLKGILSRKKFIIGMSGLWILSKVHIRVKNLRIFVMVPQKFLWRALKLKLIWSLQAECEKQKR